MSRRNSRPCHPSAQNPRKIRLQGTPVSLRCAWQSPDHELRTRGQRRSCGKSQSLQTPSHEISIHGHTDRLGYDEAESRRQRRVAVIQVQQQMTGRHSSTVAHEASIVISPDEPVGFSQHGSRLRGEFGASLASARTQNGTAGTGTHSQAESVHFGAAPIVRLEGSLAHVLGLSHVRTTGGQLGKSSEASEVKVGRQAEVN